MVYKICGEVNKMVNKTVKIYKGKVNNICIILYLLYI